jgi:hypothetical protein
MREPRTGSGTRRVAPESLPRGCFTLPIRPAGWLPSESPLNRLRAVQVEAVRKCLCDVELLARNVWAPIEDLRQDLVPMKADIQPHPAREHRMCNTLCRIQQGPAAGRAPMRRGRAIRGSSCRVVTVCGTRNGDGSRELGVTARIPPRDRDGCNRGDKRDSGKPDRSLDECRDHVLRPWSSSPHASRTSPSKSAGRVPSGPANSRRYISR